MKSSIETLESRTFLTAATHDYTVMLSDELNITPIFSQINQQESLIRGALHLDLNRLGLFRANSRSLATLARDELSDIHVLQKVVLTFGRTLNADARLLIVRGSNLQKYPKNVNVQAAFSSALGRFEQHEANNFQTILNDATAASTGKAASDLAAVAALDPTDITLQSDQQSGVTNLTASFTGITSSVELVNGDAFTFVNDSTGVELYGNVNLFGLDYSTRANPFTGTSISGLAPNVTTVATTKYAGPATFSPTAIDYPGTDQIYVGSDQTPAAGQIAGPQVITLDYSALTKLAHPIKTFTLGIATDGFENPTINIPYTVSINGVPNAALTNVLNSLDDADRVEQFVTIGISPSQLLPTKVLTISIDGPGDGVSGWAVDFLTVGIQNG